MFTLYFFALFVSFYAEQYGISSYSTLIHNLLRHISTGSHIFIHPKPFIGVVSQRVNQTIDSRISSTQYPSPRTVLSAPSSVSWWLCKYFSIRWIRHQRIERKTSEEKTWVRKGNKVPRTIVALKHGTRLVCPIFSPTKNRSIFELWNGQVV